MTNEITKNESAKLAELEAVIERGIKTFADVGNALLAIRDSRLYRAEYTTFEGYCRERWGFSKAYAHRMIAASEVVNNVSPMGDKPSSERQARPLAQLPPVRQAEAWKAATETAKSEGRKVTAADVEAVVEEQKETKEGERKRPPSDGMVYANSAIHQLKQITKNDLKRKEAFEKVKGWIDEHIC